MNARLGSSIKLRYWERFRCKDRLANKVFHLRAAIALQEDSTNHNRLRDRCDNASGLSWMNVVVCCFSPCSKSPIFESST